MRCVSLEKKGGEKRQWQDDSGSYIIVCECGNLGSPVDRRFSVAAPLCHVATTKHETNTYFSRGPKLGPAARSAVGRPTATSQDHPSARCDVTRVTTEPAHRLLRNFCSDAVENSIRLVSLARRTHEQGRLPSKYYDCAADYERGGSTTKQTHQAVALPQNG